MTSDGQIRSGIIGAGLMGRWHAAAIRYAGGKLVAVADPDRARSQGIAGRDSNVTVFSDLSALIRSSEIDVLHVCTPIESHYDISMNAIAAGINVFIEKPLAATLPETKELYDAAAKRNVSICPVHQFPFQDGAIKARKALAEIGELVHLEAKIFSAGGGSSGGDLDPIAVDILPHPLSLMQSFLANDLSEVKWEHARPRDGEIRLAGVDGKVTLEICVSMNARPPQNIFTIAGTEGTLCLDLFHGFSFVRAGKVSRFGKVVDPFDHSLRRFSAAAANLAKRGFSRESAYPGLRQLTRAFYDSILNDTCIPIPPAYAISIANIRKQVSADPKCMNAR